MGSICDHPAAAGGRGKKAPDNIRSFGTSAAYLVARLKRDHPKIAEALARGEFSSARAAGIAAGIVIIKTPLDHVLHWSREEARPCFQLFARPIIVGPVASQPGRLIEGLPEGGEGHTVPDPIRKAFEHRELVLQDYRGWCACRNRASRRAFRCAIRAATYLHELLRTGRGRGGGA